MGKTITPDDFFETSSRWLTNDSLITFYTSVVQKRHAEVQQSTDRGYNKTGLINAQVVLMQAVTTAGAINEQYGITDKAGRRG